MSSETRIGSAAARPPMLASAGVFALSLATIAGAWGFQLIGGYVPCKLCLEQRIPYYVGVPLALVTLVLAATRAAPERVVRMLLALLALVFLAGLGLAVYHAGAEWSFWAGPADCGGGQALAGSVEDLMRQVENIKVVSCVEASWRFLGLSFAGWNAVTSLVLVATCLWGAFARRA